MLTPYNYNAKVTIAEDHIESLLLLNEANYYGPNSFKKSLPIFLNVQHSSYKNYIMTNFIVINLYDHKLKLAYRLDNYIYSKKFTPTCN